MRMWCCAVRARGRGLPAGALWPVCISFLIAALLCGGSARAQQFPPTAAAPAIQSVEAQRDYVIGAQDLLHISILESPELTREVRVSADGTIGLPLLPARVHVQGLMLSEAEVLLQKNYQEAGILNRPNITITVKELQSKPVTVMGAVRSPGVFQVSGQTRLLRVLTQAGGISEEAGAIVQVIRAGAVSAAQVERIRIQDLREGVLEANIAIYGGDTVNVIPGGAVYVVGAVNSPGRHVLGGDAEQLTVLRVIALAHDLKSTAKPDRSVILRKEPGTSEIRQIPVDVRQILARRAPDVAVQPNDVLFVPDSAAKRAFRRGLEAALQVATGIALVGIR